MDSSLKIMDNSFERGSANIKAINMLKQIEAEGRRATSDEQNILSHYIGWGGLPEWFDSNKSNYSTLKNSLTEEEYKAARSTVTDSFYTPRIVMDAIYQALDRFGFKGGNILEPAMGIGNFYSAMPEEMKKNSKPCFFPVSFSFRRKLHCSNSYLLVADLT